MHYLFFRNYPFANLTLLKRLYRNRKYLDKNKIGLGTTLKIIAKESFDNSLTLESNSSRINISKEVSNNLYVKKNKKC